MTAATKPEITWTIEANGDSYGFEPMDDETFNRYVEILEREITAAFPEYDIYFRIVPENVSYNNRPSSNFEGDEDVLEPINNIIGSNWTDWLEEAGA